MGVRQRGRSGDGPGPDEVALRFGLRIDDDGTAHVLPADQVPPDAAVVDVDLDLDEPADFAVRIDADGSARVVPIAEAPADAPVVEVDLAGVEVELGSAVADRVRASARSQRRRPVGFVLPVVGAVVAGVPGFLAGAALSWARRRRG